MVFPCLKKMKSLYKLSLEGDVNELKKQAALLNEADVKLKPFATEMQAFLKDYLVDELGGWLERAMTEKNGQS